MRALRTAASGMAAQQLNVEVISNNIANMNTVGYKRQRAEFQDLIYQNVERMGAQSSSQGTVVPTGIQVGLGVKAGSVYRITDQGTPTQTGSDYDVAIDGDGAFFKIQDGAGEAYTRDGAFTIDPTGQLVTKSGLPVLGESGPIVIDPARGPITVADDGNISQNGVTIGQLGLARFDNLAVLSKEGDGLYRNASNAAPIDAAGAQVRQGMLEGSNVNPLIEITQLIEISRAYERATKMIENVTELSRRSVERLGRVS